MTAKALEVSCRGYGCRTERGGRTPTLQDDTRTSYKDIKSQNHNHTIEAFHYLHPPVRKEHGIYLSLDPKVSANRFAFADQSA